MVSERGKGKISGLQRLENWSESKWKEKKKTEDKRKRRWKGEVGDRCLTPKKILRIKRKEKKKVEDKRKLRMTCEFGGL